MSKKSRRRNKRLLALAGLAGAVALSKRKGTGTGVSGSDKAKFTSDEAYSPPKETSKDTSKSNVTVEPKKVNNNTFRTRQRITDSSGNTVESAGMRPNVVKGILPPSQNNMYKTNAGTSNPRRAGLKSGGKVKGCGIAKRGLGRAMKKGKR